MHLQHQSGVMADDVTPSGEKAPLFGDAIDAISRSRQHETRALEKRKQVRRSEVDNHSSQLLLIDF